MVEEGEKMGVVYIYRVWHAVLHAVESSAICFLQIIQQLQDELATLRWEQKERKAAEAAEEEKRAAVAAEARVSLAIWKATCLVCKQLSFHTEKKKERRLARQARQRERGREGERLVEVEGEGEGEVEGGGEGKVDCRSSTIMILCTKNQRWLGVVTRNRLISSTPIYGPLITIYGWQSRSIRLARTDIVHIRTCMHRVMSPI